MEEEDWHIRELRSASKLETEGSVMKHCVATYADSCRNGRQSIWTVETVDYDPIARKGRKSVTIAVDLLSKSISEVRGEWNRKPTNAEIRNIKRWADQEGLYYEI